MLKQLCYKSFLYLMLQTYIDQQIKFLLNEKFYILECLCFDSAL